MCEYEEVREPGMRVTEEPFHAELMIGYTIMYLLLLQMLVHSILPYCFFYVANQMTFGHLSLLSVRIMSSAAPNSPATEGGRPLGPDGKPLPGPQQMQQVMAQRRMAQQQAQVDEVCGIMTDNLEKVLERDARLNELDERADALQDGASQFEKQAGKLKNKFWMENLKSMIMMGIVAIILLLLIYYMFFASDDRPRYYSHPTAIKPPVPGPGNPMGRAPLPSPPQFYEPASVSDTQAE